MLTPPARLGYLLPHESASSGRSQRAGARAARKAISYQFRKILERHGVDHIVIGHTLVNEVGPLDETGAVIAIDVKWKDADKCQGLLQEAGQLYRVSIDGTREKIELGK